MAGCETHTQRPHMVRYRVRQMHAWNINSPSAQQEQKKEGG